LELSNILNSLHRTGTKEQNLEKLKKEAKSIKSGGDERRDSDRVKAKILDLDSIAFAEGGRLMSNKTCTLPPGSFRKQKKGYEEVHVSALKIPPMDANEKLVNIKDMREWAQIAFEGMKT